MFPMIWIVTKYLKVEFWNSVLWSKPGASVLLMKAYINRQIVCGAVLGDVCFCVTSAAARYDLICM